MHNWYDNRIYHHSISLYNIHPYMFRHFCVIIRELYMCLAKLYDCDFNSFNFKNLCNLARHKCKIPWWWHRNVETCSSNIKNTVVILIAHLLVVIKTTCNNVGARAPFRTARPRYFVPASCSSRPHAKDVCVVLNYVFVVEEVGYCPCSGSCSLPGNGACIHYPNAGRNSSLTDVFVNRNWVDTRWQ
jgi:hypothetical protein